MGPTWQGCIAGVAPRYAHLMSRSAFISIGYPLARFSFSEASGKCVKSTCYRSLRPIADRQKRYSLSSSSSRQGTATLAWIVEQLKEHVARSSRKLKQ